jgi:putative hemolysin
MYEFRDLVGIRNLPDEEENSYATLGGFALSQLGRIPSPADHFEINSWRFEIVDMDGNRIDKILVAKIPD